ncbi:MAG: ASKHA domain-containing protein [Dehalococcoidia bacterium]
MKQSFGVTFQPLGKSAQVTEGVLLLDAAVEAGLAIDTPCGGQGRCGRCMVRVESGQVSHRENPHLTPQQMEQGWVLSCTARVAGDLVISVPPQRERERVVAETAAARSALPVWSDWPQYPLVRQLFLEIPPPSLEDNTTDLERLRRTLEREHGIDNLAIELPLMRNLAAILRQGQWKVTATVALKDVGGARLIGLRPGRSRGPLLAVAVDIGTTNVVIDLVNLRSGRAIDRVSSRNRQIARGEDVISRIVYTERQDKGLGKLQRLVIETINELLAELAQKHRFATTDIEEMVAAGNTTMLHLFLGLPPKHIREEPYIPTASHFPLVTAGELGLAINPQAPVYCLPAVAAYVGGDITAGVLSSCLYKADKLTLFLDVGTNGEIVLGNSDWMVACACSAGPAFEGAGVRCGMRAVKGAIEEVTVSSKTLEPTIKVIGNVAPQGICGSGMISALAEMLITGVVDRAGRINLDSVASRMGKRSRLRIGDHGPEYVLAWGSGDRQDIVLSEVDIDNLIRTKAAVYAGIMVMARSTGIPVSDVAEVLIGGAFGQHIDVEKAIQIGLLPDLPWERFKFLGNTSAWGAYNALLSKYARAKVEEIADKITYLELIADGTFMSEFTAALFLPHTNIDNFPSIKALLTRQEN